MGFITQFLNLGSNIIAVPYEIFKDFRVTYPEAIILGFNSLMRKKK